LQDSITQSQTEIVTVSLRRQMSASSSISINESMNEKFWDLLQSMPLLTFLPNTAGCHSIKEAITTAHMAQQIFGTHWIKLEVIGDDYTLAPDPFGLLEAAKILIQDGFNVFPYMT